MPVSVLAPLNLAELAVANGATTPNPGTANALIWSTTTNAIMRWNGTSWTTQLAGNVNAAVFPVNLGSSPVFSVQVAVTLTGIRPYHSVIASVVDGGDGEREMDPLVVSGRCAVSDIVELTVASVEGPVTGTISVALIYI